MFHFYTAIPTQGISLRNISLINENPCLLETLDSDRVSADNLQTSEIILKDREEVRMYNVQCTLYSTLITRSQKLCAQWSYDYTIL